MAPDNNQVQHQTELSLEDNHVWREFACKWYAYARLQERDQPSAWRQIHGWFLLQVRRRSSPKVFAELKIQSFHVNLSSCDGGRPSTPAGPRGATCFNWGILDGGHFLGAKIRVCCAKRRQAVCNGLLES